ncbi:hypothetical protein [Fredinandcohnia quinoae]|uniref:DUF3953 domain-containing protein n=1 Tax=Fredinandcohnia quinoae TaxID=2918902 RepID=A0AAW5E5C4_9BACI|nr:hypothetical protein [Fredinandcohnia sp. SECRCQ15]MCH1627713.1 hypothetical protein [Fredinandcohnia sp. SECRCQ15]
MPKNYILPNILLILMAATFLVIGLLQNTLEQFSFFIGLTFIVIGVVNCMYSILAIKEKRRDRTIIFLVLALTFFIMSGIFITLIQ